VAKGTQQDPFLVAPDDSHDNGLPYGAFCRCGSCGLVARSTIMFDYYADGPRGILLCETCKIGTPQGTHVLTDRAAEKDRDVVTNFGQQR
jgi:hypothetical protein